MRKTTLTLLFWIIVLVCLPLVLLSVRRSPASGWTTDERGTVYLLNGQPATGWQDIDGSRYYFGEDGRDAGLPRTGWQEIGGERYYFDDAGRMVTGWMADAHYIHPDGTLATDWLELDGKLYYLGQDGRRKMGIVEVNGKEYLLNDQGYVSYGWTTVFDRLYYADSEGQPLRGWQEIDGKTHYFEESGAAASGWVEMNGFTYYFYTDGSPAQGRLVIDGQTHYFASTGQQLLLVNPWNYLPEDYTVDLVSIYDNHQIASIAYEDFLDMMTDCEQAGNKPAVCSSYRTQEYQEMLYQNRIDRYVQVGYSEEEATELAGQSVAIPGTSEHQLGLALDIVDNNNWRLDESQAETPTQQWLMENSWRYGWILRYPSETSAYTGIVYEPWHYRYVGRTVAKEIYEMGVCLEEYFEILTDSVG